MILFSGQRPSLAERWRLTPTASNRAAFFCPKGIIDRLKGRTDYDDASPSLFQNYGAKPAPETAIPTVRSPLPETEWPTVRRTAGQRALGCRRGQNCVYDTLELPKKSVRIP